MSNKLKLCIIFSLLLNVLLGGVVLGHFYHRFSRDHMPLPVSRQMASLPEVKKKELQETMEQLRQESRATFKQMKQLRQEVGVTLKAETFDAATYDEQMEQLYDLQVQQWQRLSDTIKKLAVKYSPEERAVLAEMLRHPPRRSEPRESKMDDAK